MKYLILTFFVLLSYITHAQNYNKDEIKVVLDKATLLLNQMQNITYEVYTEEYQSYRADTLRRHCKVYIQEDRKAKHLFKCLFNMKDITHDLLYVFNSDTVLYNIGSDKTTNISFIDADGSGIYGPLFGDVIVFHYFSEKKFYPFLLKSKRYKDLHMIDSVVNNEAVQVVKFQYQPKKSKDIQHNLIAFRVSDGFPVYAKTIRINNQNEIETESQLFTKININTDLPKDVFVVKSKIPEDHTIIPFGSNFKRTVTPTGVKAPAFSLENLNGELVELEQFKGQVVLLDFWFAGCIPCRKLTPELIKLKDKYPDLQIIGINPIDSKVTAERYLELVNIKNTNQILSKEMAKNYQITTYPSLVVIDKKGKVVYSSIFEPNKKNIKNLEKVLKNELKK